ITIEGISAISTGAMTASVLASALTQGGANEGRQQARVALESFWRKVSAAMSLTPFRPTIFDKFLGNTRLEFSPSFAALDFITQVFSPYQFNLFDINPFKDILDELVDFASLNKNSKLRLFLGATNVFTGKSHIFSEKTASLEAILASA